MNKFKDIENAIMAFGPILGHAWIARELTAHFEAEKDTDISPAPVEKSSAKVTPQKVAQPTRNGNPEWKLG